MRTFPARGLLMAAAIATASLAACSRSQPDEAVEANVEAPAEPMNVVPAEPTPLPEPSPVANVATNVTDLPPEEAPAPDEQVLDDASITGMTARVHREDTTDEAPAKQK